jgi:hypothetical protein
VRVTRVEAHADFGHGHGTENPEHVGGVAEEKVRQLVLEHTGQGRALAVPAISLSECAT